MSRGLWTGIAILSALAVTAAPAQTQPAGDGMLRLGVFDPESLWKLTDLGKKYNADLTQARDRLQSEIDKRSQELEDMKDKLRQQQASLSDDKVTQMQKDILGKRTDLDRMNEDATKEMKYQLNDVQGRFQQLLMQTIEVYGKEKNYALIMNRGVIDYNAPSIDITQDLIAKFNEMHKVPPGAARTSEKKPPEKPKTAPRNPGSP